MTLENDANAAAFGEWKVGAGHGTRDFIYITVSTGIGAGIVSNGLLVSGTSYSAAEFGHLTLDWRGTQCGCGNFGCLEMYASGTAIARRAAEAVAEKNPEARAIADLANAELDMTAKISTDKPITAKHVSMAAAVGDSYFRADRSSE